MRSPDRQRRYMPAIARNVRNNPAPPSLWRPLSHRSISASRKAPRKCLPARPARRRRWNAGFVPTAVRGSITFRTARPIRTATSSRGRWMIHHGWSRRLIFGLAARRSGSSSPKTQQVMKRSPRPWAGPHRNPRLAPAGEKESASLKAPILAQVLVLPLRIELRTSPLPGECSTTELRQRTAGPSACNEAAPHCGVG